MMQQTFYHSLLRVSSLTVALVLVFQSGLISPATHDLSVSTQNYLASAIGIQASVTPNELNQLTAELTAQKRNLDEREAALGEREISVGLNSNTSDSLTTFVLSAILFLLLLLILLNYVLDYLRQNKSNQTLVTS